MMIRLRQAMLNFDLGSLTIAFQGVRTEARHSMRALWICCVAFLGAAWPTFLLWVEVAGSSFPLVNISSMVRPQCYQWLIRTCLINDSFMQPHPFFCVGWQWHFMVFKFLHGTRWACPRWRLSSCSLISVLKIVVIVPKSVWFFSTVVQQSIS